MKKIISLFIIICFLGCKNENNNKKQQTNIQDTQQVKPKKQEEKTPVITTESKLNGQFRFGLSQADKQKWRTTSRAYKVRSATANSIKIKLTFYGNGQGVYFNDNGKYEYMTQKMIDDASFTYKVNKDSIMIKGKQDKKYKLFGLIKEESINKDYFDIDLIGKADFDITFGMYKIGESPKK
ncbi:hypothetical protein PL373_01720 [Tenacibaculum maritimum]|nr:hypothetical protein [Tenacibaculum maritimum]MDB0599890.1 hypothetical protein [Tenacibaculum maritimum]MDB0611036.1 hypothetical protein [Tenacibaculum maritimum]